MVSHLCCTKDAGNRKASFETSLVNTVKLGFKAIPTVHENSFVVNMVHCICEVYVYMYVTTQTEARIIIKNRLCSHAQNTSKNVLFFSCSIYQNSANLEPSVRASMIVFLLKQKIIILQVILKKKVEHDRAGGLRIYYRDCSICRHFSMNCSSDVM